MRSSRASIAASVITFSAIAAQIAYIRADRAYPTYDDAWYIEQSFRLFDALRMGLLPFLKTYAGLFHIKAPLISVLPLPFIALFGRSIDTVLAVNVAASALLAASLFLLGRRLYSDRAACFALPITFTFPLLYGLSCRYFVEYALTALVCTWLLLLEQEDILGEPAPSYALGVLLGMGLLLKVTFPLYILGPVLLWGQRARRGWSPERTRILLRQVLLPALLVAGTWYAFNWMYIAGFAWQASYGQLAHQYGSASWAAARFMVRHIFRSGISDAHGFLLLAVLASRLLRRNPFTRRDAFLLSWIALPLLACFTAVNKDLRYLAPALPALALFIAGEFDERLPKGLPGAAVFTLLLAWPLDILAVQTTGRSLLVPLEQFSYNSVPAGPRDLSQEAILSYLDREVARGRGNASVVIALEHPYFNANLFACLAAMRKSPLSFASLGYAQDSAEKAFIRIKERDAHWILIAEGLPSVELPPWFNQTNAEVERRMRTGYLGFRREMDFLSPGGSRLTLYSR